MRISTPLALTALLLAALLGCKTQPKNPIPTDPSITDTGATGADTAVDATVDEGSGPMESATAVDSTGNPADCTEDQWAHYTCKGWIAPLYTRTDGLSPNDYQFYFGDSPDTRPECVTIPMCRPYFGDFTDDDEYAYTQCKEECDAEVANGEHDDWPTTFSYSGTSFTLRKTVCVFADNGNNGYVPNPTDGVTNTPGVFAAGSCGWGPSTTSGGAEIHDTVIYDGCFDDDVCEDETGVACSNWTPGVYITHSVTGTAHTATIDDVLLYALLDGGHDLGMLYKCDDGYFMNIGIDPAELWKMVGLTSKDTLYKLGFRSNDYQFRVKKTGTSTWYPLDTLAHLLAAFNALYPGTTSFTFDWRRPVSGSYATHTLVLTVV